MIIKSRLAPKDKCLNLFGTLWTRDTSWIDKYVINHERIHNAQMREMLWIPFYLWYVTEWLVKFVRYRDWEKAYFAISFEKEAYAHGDDLKYLGRRKHFAWLRMLRRANS